MRPAPQHITDQVREAYEPVEHPRTITGAGAIERTAAAIERTAADATLSQAVDDLAAAAEQLRQELWHHSHTYSFRQTAAVSGLSLATVQRWRHELPVSETLRRRA